MGNGKKVKGNGSKAKGQPKKCGQVAKSNACKDQSKRSKPSSICFGCCHNVYRKYIYIC